jgi:Tol biopolymer transport system component/predicted Ser/Thr protein kinase
MPIESGSHLGPYEIVSSIGAGGMGEVYRARDKRLERTVAIKVLAPSLSGDPEYRQRFEREARTVAALSHPRICPVYDIGTHDGLDYLVMEYLEGENLASRIAKGPLPVEEALRYGIQIADALDQAHRHGVVHRDLKPGNIMLTKSGAKLLDFGLAKGIEPRAGGSSSPSNLTSLPTATTPLTGQGLIVGTLQYMAPEQLEGGEADARTDLFAFGLILYEMIAGRRAFEARSQAAVISSIMSSSVPALSSHNSGVPPALDHLVSTCIAKDPDVRWQNATDVLLQLKWITEGGGGPHLGPPGSGVAAAAPPAKQRNLVLWSALGASVCAAMILSWVHFTERPAPPRLGVRFAIHSPADAVFFQGTDTPILSPDGTRLIFTASRRTGVRVLWHQPLDSMEAKPLPGTENALLPFWSPDSRSVAFYSETDKKLRKVDLSGGPAVTLCAVQNGSASGAWLANGSLIFYDDGKLMRIASTGGEPKPLLGADIPAPKMTQLWPRALPDGKHILFLAVGPPDKEGIYAANLESGQTRMVLPVRSLFEYSPDGYILYGRQEAIMAQRFDASKLASEGDPTPVVERALAFSAVWGPVASASANGTLVYSRPVNRAAQLHWYTRDGKKLGSIEGARNYSQLLLSPDGRRVAFELNGTEKTPNRTLWVLELSTGIPSLVTPNTEERYSDAVWSPDSRDLVYARFQGFKPSIVRKPAGGGPEQVVISQQTALYPEEVLPDGSIIALSQNGKDIVRIPPSGGKPESIFHTDFESDEPHVSPDGRWITYSTNESGQWEVYVAAFPSFGSRRQLSNAGGMGPVWRADGKELFYLSPLGKLMSAGFKSGGTQAETSVPSELFQTRLRADNRYNQYTVTSDGQRFLLYEPVEDNDRPYHVVMNWTSLLKR